MSKKKKRDYTLVSIQLKVPVVPSDWSVRTRSTSLRTFTRENISFLPPPFLQTRRGRRVGDKSIKSTERADPSFFKRQPTTTKAVKRQVSCLFRAWLPRPVGKGIRGGGVEKGWGKGLGKSNVWCRDMTFSLYWRVERGEGWSRGEEEEDDGGRRTLCLLN